MTDRIINDASTPLKHDKWYPATKNMKKWRAGQLQVSSGYLWKSSTHHFVGRYIASDVVFLVKILLMGFLSKRWSVLVCFCTNIIKWTWCDDYIYIFFNSVSSAKMEPPFTVRLQKQPLSSQALIQALRELVTNATFSSNINLVPRALSGHCVVVTMEARLWFCSVY